jgi:hypothetical protein
MTKTMPDWVNIVVQLTPAFITLVVGLIASVVAYRQYKTTNDKLRLDQFDKRLEAFEKLQEYFASLIRTGQVHEQTLATLAQARYKSLFLFGPEVEAWFDELWKNATEMHRLLSDRESNAVNEKKAQLLKWNLDQMENCHARYAPYMRFKK